MNPWWNRVGLVAVFLAAMNLHTFCSATLPNTPIGMLVFHGTAGMVDLLLLYVSPALISGRVCDDTQLLCLVSIGGNFIGWILYLAYAPPSFYNVFMWSLTYVQFARLLLDDRNDNSADSLGFRLVHGIGLGRLQLHSKEA